MGIREKMFNALRQVRNRLYDRRRRVARRWLAGNGLEVGALHQPMRVPRSVRVQYVDLVSREENIRRFPHLNAAQIVDVTFIDDGFELTSLDSKAYDFLIANHVLEHSPNPIRVLENWSRVIAPDGVLFVTVPLLDKTFDRGRVQTSVAHMKEDYRLYKDNDQTELRLRNSEHLREWITISEPAIKQGSGQRAEKWTEQEVEARIAREDLTRCEIHFHTFSVDSFSELLGYFVSYIAPAFTVGDVVRNRSEVIGILKRDRT